MSYTIQQVVDHARVPLQDVAKVRYSDAVLLQYHNDAIEIAYKTRPDLFIGNWRALEIRFRTLEEEFPLPSLYRSYVADYIAGRAELVDDEYSESNRAMMFIQSFMLGLKT